MYFKFGASSEVDKSAQLWMSFPVWGFYIGMQKNFHILSREEFELCRLVYHTSEESKMCEKSATYRSQCKSTLAWLSLTAGGILFF